MFSDIIIRNSIYLGAWIVDFKGYKSKFFLLNGRILHLRNLLQQTRHLPGEGGGYVKVGEEHKVCKLKKALYGQKQTSRAWYSCINDYLSKQGFKKYPYERTLFNW